MKRKYLIGSDPEIFVVNEDDTLSSSIGIFKGTKDNPIDIGEGCFVQEDNILVEFNIPPVTNLEDFLKSMNYSKNYIETILAPLGKKLYYSSSEIATEELLKQEGAKVFGCSPSFNVVTESVSCLDINQLDSEVAKIRSSGFHIHLGYDNPTEEHNDRLVLCFELFVTLPLLNSDNDKYNRRKLYGLLGDSRTKDYGVECRSLGGYFLKDDSTLTLLWKQIQKALEFADESKLTNEELRNFILFCMDENNEINLDSLEIVLSHLEIKELKIA